MFGAVVAGAEFENHFHPMLFSHSPSFPFAVRLSSADTNHMSAIFSWIGGLLVDSQECLVAGDI